MTPACEEVRWNKMNLIVEFDLDGDDLSSPLRLSFSTTNCQQGDTVENDKNVST